MKVILSIDLLTIAYIICMSSIFLIFIYRLKKKFDLLKEDKSSVREVDVKNQEDYIKKVIIRWNYVL